MLKIDQTHLVQCLGTADLAVRGDVLRCLLQKVNLALIIFRLEAYGCQAWVRISERLRAVDTSGWLSQQRQPLKANIVLFGNVAFLAPFGSIYIWQRGNSQVVQQPICQALTEIVSVQRNFLSWGTFDKNLAALPIRLNQPFLLWHLKNLASIPNMGFPVFFSPHNGWLHYGWLKCREQFLVNLTLEPTLWPCTLTGNLIVLSGSLDVSIVSWEVDI